MTKLSKQKCIELILIEIQKGSPYKQTFAVIQSKTKLVESTFASYWKIANEQYTVAQQAIQKERAEVYRQNELEGQNKAIIDRNKLLEMTTNVVKVAYNNAIKIKDDKSINAFGAISDRYAKLQGFEAPKEFRDVTPNEIIIEGSTKKNESKT
jgi:hypothetical protein